LVRSDLALSTVSKNKKRMCLTELKSMPNNWRLSLDSLRSLATYPKRLNCLSPSAIESKYNVVKEKERPIWPNTTFPSCLHSESCIPLVWSIYWLEVFRYGWFKKRD
jgi:hypothetical protein